MICDCRGGMRDAGGGRAFMGYDLRFDSHRKKQYFSIPRLLVGKIAYVTRQVYSRDNGLTVRVSPKIALASKDIHPHRKDTTV